MVAAKSNEQIRKQHVYMYIYGSEVVHLRFCNL